MHLLHQYALKCIPYITLQLAVSSFTPRISYIINRIWKQRFTAPYSGPGAAYSGAGFTGPFLTIRLNFYNAYELEWAIVIHTTVLRLIGNDNPVYLANGTHLD